MEKREVIGNSKRITIDDNKIHLRIIGNGNKINLKNNSGLLDVIGNSTSVKIADNSGYVNYFGNSGKLYFGTNSRTSTVKYNGNDGTMKVMNTSNLWKNSNNHKAKGSSTTSSSNCSADKYLASTNCYDKRN